MITVCIRTATLSLDLLKISVKVWRDVTLTGWTSAEEIDSGYTGQMMLDIIGVVKKHMKVVVKEA